jgi:hypothetical protein
VEHRTFSLISNGSWTKGISAKLMKEKLSHLRHCEMLGDPVILMSSAGPQEEQSIEKLADEIAAHITGK